jgi:hypothetical protein
LCALLCLCVQFQTCLADRSFKLSTSRLTNPRNNFLYLQVGILDASGALLEESDAVTDDSARNLWKYIVTLNPAVACTTIRATAFDKPGNTGTLEQVI